MTFAGAALLVCLAGCAARPAPPVHPAGVPIVLRPPAPARRAFVGGRQTSGFDAHAASGDAAGLAHAAERSGASETAEPFARSSEDTSGTPSLRDTAGDSPAQVIRDTAALNRQATAYVIGPDSRHAVVETLARLNSSAVVALQRLRQHRDDAVAQAADLAAARASADAMASYLAKEAKPPKAARDAAEPEHPPPLAPTPPLPSNGPQAVAP